MQGEDIKLIRQIVASDGRKYTAGNIDRSRYNRLVDLGWLTPFKMSISDVEYQITEKGRTASVANAHVILAHSYQQHLISSPSARARPGGGWLQSHHSLAPCWVSGVLALATPQPCWQTEGLG
ncbi:MAG TPA: hypothetical protein VNZ53_38860 [Steroidobacteraceae bacterium]|nr:hypothetical protein [Steroidobacteraceae bacterium]